MCCSRTRGGLPVVQRFRQGALMLFPHTRGFAVNGEWFALDDALFPHTRGFAAQFRGAYPGIDVVPAHAGVCRIPKSKPL